jgi:chitinase
MMGTTCSTIRVLSGDSCASLATRCDINTTAFYHYNPKSDLCSTTCCGAVYMLLSGLLPNLAPPPNANGTCASYLVQHGDTCNEIALSYSPLTTAEIEQYNAVTCGWLGCSDLQPGNSIDRLCLMSIGS